MTPSGLTLDHIITLGLVGLFGGALLYGLVGWVVARFRGFETGIGTGMMLFGLSGLGSAAWIYAFTHFETTEMLLPRTGCEPLPALSSRSSVRSIDEFRLPGSHPVPRKAVLEPAPRPCPETDEPPVRLRLRLDDLESGAIEIPASRVDAVDPVALMGVFGAFGGFGFLGGIVLLASGAQERRRRLGIPDPAPLPVGERRRFMAGALNAAGTLTAVAGLVAAGFVDDTVRAFSLAFNGPALACACYFVSSVLLRRATVAHGAMMLLLGGGFALAAASVRYLG